MSQYKLIYLDEKKSFKTYETIEMRFVLLNLSTNTIVTTFTGYTISANITCGGTDTKLDNDARGGVATSDSVITMTIPATSTDDYEEKTYYDIEIFITVSSKNYKVWSERLYIGKEFIDWL